MPLRPSEPPASTLEAVQDGTRSIVAARRSGTPALRAADPAGLTFETPIQVFFLGASDLTAGAGLDAARPVAWRYIVREGGRPIASAEAATQADGSHSFSHLNEGPFVESTVDALAAAEGLPDLGNAEFDRRLLEIPALHSVSLWLHEDAATGHDVVVPLAPAPPDLEAGKPYAAAAFLAVLVKRAARIGEEEGLKGTHGS